MSQQPQNDLTEWSVSVVVESPDERRPAESPAWDRVFGALRSSDRDGVVVEDDGTLGVRFTVRAPNALHAVGEGVAIWHAVAQTAGIATWPVVRAEASTYDQLERQIRASALPPLVGVAEVADMLQVSKPRVCALSDQQKLPRPLIRLASGPVWTAAGIEKFKRERRDSRSDGYQVLGAADEQPEVQTFNTAQ
jgi:hypothetical protein